MSWSLKESNLILLICCLAVSAVKIEDDTPRHDREQITKLFVNPLNLLYSKFTTPKPVQPTKIILIKPQYPPEYYPVKYPNRPTKKPRPSKKPSKRPQNPQLPRPVCPPNYTYYTWQNAASTYGYHQNPVGVCIPTNYQGNNNGNNGNGNNGNNGNGNNGNSAPNNNRPNNNANPNNNAPNNNTPNNNTPNNNTPNNNTPTNNTPNNNTPTNNTPNNNAPNPNTNGGNDIRFFLRGPINSYLENENIDDYDYEADGRTAENDAASIFAGSTGDNDDNSEFVADTKDVKLPIVIHLDGQAITIPFDSSKKIKDQETLIYLRNLRKGRKLETNKLV